MARVRIVVPTYNRAALLEEALATIVGQSVQDFEVIVSDDGSTDGTRDVLAHWQRRDRLGAGQ
jgi:glycosyltransferase involved in cell wall biosynthesis